MTDEFTIFAGGYSASSMSTAPILDYGTTDSSGNYVLPDEEIDVFFGYAIETNYRSLALIPPGDPHLVTFLLPTYKDKDGITKTAVFIPEDNPLWELSSDGLSVTTKTYILINKNALKLRFPLIKSAQRTRG